MHRSYYYRDPLCDDFAQNGIKHKPLENEYEYISRAKHRKMCDRLLHSAVATPIAFASQKLCWGEKIIGREKIRPYLDNGVFLYGNHTRGAGDAFCPTCITFPKKPYIIANSDSVALPAVRVLVKMLGGLPIPDDIAGLQRFKSAVMELSEKNTVVIYP